MCVLCSCLQCFTAGGRTARFADCRYQSLIHIRHRVFDGSQVHRVRADRHYMTVLFIVRQGQETSYRAIQLNRSGKLPFPH